MAEKKRRSLSIRAQLILASLVLVLIPLGGLGATLLIRQYNSVVTTTNDNLVSNSALQWSSLNAKISGEEDTLALLANDLGNNKMLVDNLPLLASPTTYELGLNGPNGDDGVNAAISGDDSATSLSNGSLIKTFNYTLTSDDDLKSVRLYTEYISSALTNCIYPIRWSELESNAYSLCRQNVASTIWIFAEGNLYAYHSVLSYSHADLPMVAMLRFQIELSQFLSGLDSTYLNNAYILADGNGNVIGSRGLANQKANDAYLSALSAKNHGSFTAENTLGVITHQGSIDWYLAYYIDRAEIMGGFLTGLWATLGIILGAFALAIVFAWLFVRRFTRRINNLKAGALRVAEGNYDEEIHDRSGDELSELALAFNKMEGEVKKTLQDMVITQDGISRTFAEILEAKSGQSGHHVKRVSEYTGILAQEYGYTPSQVHDIMIASMLHDVGKIMIPNSILDKPGKLTDEEYAVMKTHVTYGGNLLVNCPGEIMHYGANIAEYHHERWDGNGYMKGLKGEEIPPEAQISSVADVFDALVSRRSYKPGWSFEDAYAEILKGRGTQFAPRAVDAFIKRFEDFKKIAEEFRDD